MDNRKHPTRMLTAIVTASVLVMALLLIPAAATAGSEQQDRSVGTETKDGPTGFAERIDEPNFACGVRCGVDLCVSDVLTSPYHWCGLYAMGDGCDGGYDPSICGGVSGF
jgi:hypothetical protein